MWQKINKVLDKYKKLSNNSTLASWICYEAQKIGDIYHFRVVKYIKNTLTINVSSNIAAQELFTQEKKIISEINQKLKNNLIKKIRYQTNSYAAGGPNG